MGYIRKKICSVAGCNDYALSNSAYCEKHQRNVSRETTSEYTQYYNTYYWRKARRAFLIKTANTWCAECLKKGEYSIADTVHHARGFINWETFCDQKYWVALCNSCHSRIHTQITNKELYSQNKDKS